MKIVHCCLSNFFIDGYSYQENELVRQNVKDGHDVTVIASTETFGPDRKLSYLQPSSYIGSEGARVIRLPYRKLFPAKVMRKLRAHPDVFDILSEAKPDIILFHGTCGWELNSVARFKRSFPATRLYVDSHEDFNNSARNMLSKWGLHYLYYRQILRRNLRSIEKILCVNVDAMEFVGNFYGVPRSMLEFYPLGGELLSDDEYERRRSATRAALGVAGGDLLFIQTGKIDRSKKLVEALNAFTKQPAADTRFLIAGHLGEDVLNEVEAIIAVDPRVRFLGWKAAEELRDLLCAADVYVQPGTQSATMQMSLCCHCAVIIDDVSSHTPYHDDNGWLVGRRLTLHEAFANAAARRGEIVEMGERSAAIAARLLDYKKLAARLY